VRRLRGRCRSSRLIYPAELVAGQRSLGLKERLSPDEALDRLLAGTGIAVQRSQPNVIVLKLRAMPVVLGGAPETAAANSTVTDSDPSAPLKEKPGQAPAEASATRSEVVVTGTLIRGPGRERRLHHPRPAPWRPSAQTTGADFPSRPGQPREGA